MFDTLSISIKVARFQKEKLRITNQELKREV
jgi:hypothetical protein